MKILFVAMSDSIHTARWVNQITDQRWKIYLFPSEIKNNIHEKISNSNVKVCIPFLLRNNELFFFRIINKLHNLAIRRINPCFYEKRLYKYIKKIKPDIIHTLETQYAGYLLYSVKEKYFKNKDFPKWWHTVWGNDIFLFGEIKEHIEKIKNVLLTCDYYSSDCKRDNILAQKAGYDKKILPLFLNGFSIDNLLEEKKNNLKTSKRKIILVKGYHGWAGRALVALYALKIIKEYLSDYKIVIYSADDISVKISAELFENETNINVALVPLNTSHSEMLKLQGSARLHIGLSISDGIPSSVLEAMAMGSFPIQSWTAATDEWIKDGENGFLVSPEDPCNVAEAMVKALTNDKLVDNAAKINWKIVKTRLNYNDLKQKAINSYRSIFEDIKNNI